MKWFVFICLSLIFLITPFKEGLYYSVDYYPINLVLFIIFLVFIIRQLTRNEIHLIKKHMIVLLLPLCYLISLPFAESPKGASDSVLKWLFYTSFFILLIWAASKPRIKELLPHLFQLLGACIALFMILDYYGWVNYLNAVYTGRFAGVFQYPNTFGMVMALFFFYSLVNLTEDKVAIKKLPLQISLSILYFVCFIQSSSRGMMMFFPLIWFVGLLLLPIKKQLKYLIYSFISILSALIVYQSMIKEQSAKVHYPGLVLFIVTILLSNILIFFINRILANHSFSFMMNKRYRFALPLAIAVIFILGFLDLRYHGPVFHQMPVQLQDRLGSINLSTPTAKERLSFFKDALKMSKSSPIIGFGGGGWGALYNKFQSVPYITNKIHNGYLEWIIDTGWLGFLLFLTVFVRFFYLLIQFYKKEINSSFTISIFLALITIFLHSFVDFDFSFGTVWLLIFWLFAMIFSDLPEKKQAEKKHLKKQANKQTIKVVDNQWKYKAILISYACFLIIGLIQSYRFITAQHYYVKANATNDNSVKELLLQKAIDGDPSNINFKLDLANSYLGQYKRTYGVGDRNKAEQLVENIGETEPHNSTVLIQIAHLSEQLGNNVQALKYFDQALRCDHFNSSIYQDSITLKVNMAIDYRNHYNVEKSNGLLNSAIANFEQEEWWYGKIDHSEVGKKYYNDKNFYITPTTQYYVGIAYFIKKDYLQVVKLTKEPKGKIGDDLLALSILANEKLGVKNQIKYSENLEKNIENLRSLLQTVTITRQIGS